MPCGNVEARSSAGSKDEGTPVTVGQLDPEAPAMVGGVALLMVGVPQITPLKCTVLIREEACL